MATCSRHLGKYRQELTDSLESLKEEFPEIYHEVKKLSMPASTSSSNSTKKLLKGGNPGTILKFLGLVILLLGAYFGKNPIEYFNTSIGKTLEAAKSMEALMHMCNSSSTDPTLAKSWIVNYKSHPPEQNPSEKQLVMAAWERTDEYALIPSLLMAQLERELLKANSFLDLDAMHKERNGVIDISITTMALDENVLYINFDPPENRCGASNFYQECTFFNKFDQPSSMENTEKFIFQNQMMIILAALRVCEFARVGMINTPQFLLESKEFAAVRKVTRAGSLHQDVGGENNIFMAFANRFPLLGTESTLLPSASLENNIETTSLNNVPKNGLFRLVIPSYGSYAVGEKYTAHAVPLHGEDVVRYEPVLQFQEFNELKKLPNNKVEKLLKVHKLNKEERKEDEDLVAKYNPDPTFRDQMFLALVKKEKENISKKIQTMKESSSHYREMFARYITEIAENLPVDSSDKYPTSFRELGIVVNGEDMSDNPIYNVFKNAYITGMQLYKISEETTETVNRNGLPLLFADPSRTRKKAHDALGYIKGGRRKSRKKNYRKPKKC
jgi:hypothetical protein